MAKSESIVEKDFKEILRGSLSATLEDSNDFLGRNSRCSVRVFERYSSIGSNRVSFNVTLFDKGDKMRFSAITSGGSDGIFWKFNTFKEESFLDKSIEIFE